MLRCFQHAPGSERNCHCSQFLRCCFVNWCGSSNKLEVVRKRGPWQSAPPVQLGRVHADRARHLHWTALMTPAARPRSQQEVSAARSSMIAGITPVSTSPWSHGCNGFAHAVRRGRLVRPRGWVYRRREGGKECARVGQAAACRMHLSRCLQPRAGRPLFWGAMLAGMWRLEASASLYVE